MNALSALEARTYLLGALADPSSGARSPRPVLLAVSGGPDSLALLFLSAENRDAIRAAGFSLAVATVDHGLREGSANEAAFVAALCRDLGLPHRTLVWEGVKPSANIAAQARTARYGLLVEHACAIDAAAVLTAHHQDDQIETHHLAALRRAGDRGLAGMRAARPLAPGLRLLRPFLGIPGAALKAAVAARGVRAVDDPANRDPRFERARLRATLRLDPFERRAVLSRIAGHEALRDAEDAALGALARALTHDSALVVDECGAVHIATQAFRSIEIGLRELLLARIFLAAGGGEYPPERPAIRRLDERLEDGNFKGATLGGARISAVGERIVLHREYGRCGLSDHSLRGAKVVSFDRRMTIALPDGGGEGDSRVLAAFGRTGAGNAVEKTLPVVVGASGRIEAAHPRLSRKLPETVRALDIEEQVSFRIFADLDMS